MGANYEEEDFSQAVKETLKSREESVSGIGRGEFSDEDDYLEPLDVEKLSLTRVLLSYGGPNEYLDIEHDGAKILRIKYSYFHWFDEATIRLDENSPLWNYCEGLIEGLER